MIQTIEEALEARLELAKKLDESQEVVRKAIKIAARSGTADELVKLSAAVKIIDEVWESNNKQVQEIKSATNVKQIYANFPLPGMG